LAKSRGPIDHKPDGLAPFRLYHRKDGKVHKEGDALLSATRYALMMLRYARTSLPPNASSSH
jgi:hypothetical protein